jgi:hypothetical protein
VMRVRNFRVAVIGVLAIAVGLLTTVAIYSVIPFLEVTVVTGIHFPYKILIYLH